MNALSAFSIVQPNHSHGPRYVCTMLKCAPLLLPVSLCTPPSFGCVEAPGKLTL